MEKKKNLVRILAVCIFEVLLLLGINELMFSEVYQSFFIDPNFAWSINHYLKISLSFGIIYGFFVGRIAERLGHNYYIWFFYGQFSALISLFHLYKIDRENINELCAEHKECFLDWITVNKDYKM